MAIKQTISLEGLQQVQGELKNLAEVGVSTFDRIARAVEGGSGEMSGFASSILGIGKAMSSLTGAVTVLAGLTGSVLALTVSASNAGEEFENLGNQLGTTSETASALITSFARAGADIEGLSAGLRRAAVNISSEWAQIQKSVGDATLKLASNNLQLQSSYINLGKASLVAANQEKNSALQREANAQAVGDAQARLDDLLEKRRIREGGVRDPFLEAERAAAREEAEIAKARLAVAQATQKAKEEEAAATTKAAEAAIAAETAQLNLAKARKQASEDQKNSIANLVGFVDELTSGITNTGREVDRTVDNIFKGIIASVGAAGHAIDEIDLSNVASPTTFSVLLKLSDALKNMSSQTEKSALVTKLMGRSAGPELVAFLSQGSDAVRTYIEDVKRLGLALGEDAVEKTQKFRRELFTLQSTISAIKNQFGAEFAPAFGPALDEINKKLIENRTHLIETATIVSTNVLNAFRELVTMLIEFNKIITESEDKVDALIKLLQVPAVFSIKVEFPPILRQGPEALTTLLLGPPGSPLRRLLLGERAPSTPAARAGAEQLNFDELQRTGKSATQEMKELDAAARAWGDSGRAAGEKAAEGATRATTAFKTLGTEILKIKSGIEFLQAPAAGTQPTPGKAGFVSVDQLGVSAIQAAQKLATAGQATPAQQQTQQQAQSAVQAFQAASDQIIAIWNSLRDAIDAVDFSGIFSGISEELVGPFLDAEEGIIAVFDAIAQEAERMAQRITQAAQQAATALQQISSGGGFGPEFSGSGFAGGGRVSGAGSWTSDSIFARLSRDEFVQPAFRVHQYGMDFMEAIRRGLLSTDAVRALMGDFRGLRFGDSAFPRFAEGGAVTSSGSRTLNLILGGQTFPVSGSAKVIDSLEREAALRSMASTGIAQSFVGRR